MGAINCQSYIDIILSNLQHAKSELNKSNKLYIINNTDKYLEVYLKQLNIDYVNIDLSNDDVEAYYKEITWLNMQEDCGGIYISSLNTQVAEYKSIIYNMINAHKDVNAVNVINKGLIAYGKQWIFNSRVASAIYIIEQLQLSEQYAVILDSFSPLGISLLSALVQKCFNVSLFDYRKANFKKMLKSADIVILTDNFKYDSKLFKKDVLIIDYGFDNEGIIQNNIPENCKSLYTIANELQQLSSLFVIYNFLRLQQLNVTQL